MLDIVKIPLIVCYLKSARESIEKQGTLNDYIQEEIDEIEKGILSLTRLS